jgi:cyclopropane fatty-acyl-phospholipid synthase-like methyltransferase
MPGEGGPDRSGEIAALFAVETLPRSAAYEPRWAIENTMGPNVLWLTEWLCQAMDLRPGMRVLDMGCGRAISSIFLAREFGVQVWATDLWIAASENRRRIEEAGLVDRIFPIHAEAHSLPFAGDFFDAALSMDAYHYFGTDDLYIGYYARFIKPGGQIGIAVPGVHEEIGQDVPEHLRQYWDWDFCSFHSPGWWQTHWAKTGLVDVTVADWMPDGWKLWLRREELAALLGTRTSPEEEAMVRTDGGRYLGFTRIVGRRREEPRYLP